jgi:ribulose-5-phosphate 4-epimerase/fuculose-1-phosphate aldolase
MPQTNLQSHLAEFLALFGNIGHRVPLWTQGRGSNLSMKIEGNQSLLIKPSGYRLADVMSERDLVKVNDLRRFQSDLHDLFQQPPSDAEFGYSRLLQSSSENLDCLRPSMETCFHALLKGRFVLHFHSVVAIIFGEFWSRDSRKGRQTWHQVADANDIDFIEYVTPGLELGRRLKNCDRPFLLLQNHGVILNSDDLSILEHWRNIEKALAHSLDCAELLNFEIETAWETMRQQPQPIGVSFPDFGLLLTKLLPELNDCGHGRYIWPQPPRKDQQDLFEIWAASWLISKYCPHFSNLPKPEIEKISGLPTEQYRLLKGIH